ncbi:Uncharacterized conserved protein, DUF1778 family [Azotobacter beijerinckii]|uniref:Uncharacterized conserved protein, DUF1778 family n=1 Tax=Azotobacter beijerinckii TaxID=170623 RepID=A0A1H6QZZ1_9GAMM|nr:DUF1778 domain-containing protein [Azotobacter beijerinckii]SEI49348.1 Uncharacterized conserved protein, DUF1778 family [Azotobacter beijerinckii]
MTTTNSERINLRASIEAKRVIETAANLLGTTVSAFMLGQAYEAAKRVLAEHELLILSAKDRDQLLALLDSPPTPNAELRELLSRAE